MLQDFILNPNTNGYSILISTSVYTALRVTFLYSMLCHISRPTMDIRAGENMDRVVSLGQWRS